MISVIVCSRSEKDFSAFRQNIISTIGIAHEIIQVDNSRNRFSISQAYNEGARQSAYPYLCFVHEDVAFETENWGTHLMALLEKKEIGLVGVAGGVLKTKATGPTWWSPLPNSARLNLIQQTSTGEKKPMHENPLNEQYSEVVALDGVFLACRKEVWSELPFDEQAVQGFHFYDLDFSLSIGQRYKVVVTYDILLEHFSEGKNDKVWAEQADKITEKWREKLPLVTVPLSKQALKEIEKQTMDFYLSMLFQLQCSKSLQWKYVLRRLKAFPTDPISIYYLKQWLKGALN